ncbi:KpsF/GutQ family sugar-phosphate isomerase [Limnohabitans sp.]|uniref:KpsF/GutQ family sugar-phosphate isomerase n=1 Tax=Limnohabitans sp. TaxID=1907725 RepID=UPI002AFE0B50|nr:KpsF/GutQ family sugar-phosphate isomerase [Limnohabitans sp.]
MNDFQAIGKSVFEVEIRALEKISAALDGNFQRAVEAILKCTGTVIVCGLGKSGHIGHKISATLASTGTKSISLHPSEALHGDLGRIGKDDLIIGISYSGETDELLQVVAYAKIMKVPVIAITGVESSTLAVNSNIKLITYVSEEACAESRVPTSSTTAALVMGDALSIALMKARNFKIEDFARLHPGGALGKLLLTKVKDYLKKAIFINETAGFREVIIEIAKGNGLLVVKRENGEVGVITDGDVRRHMQQFKFTDMESLIAENIMSINPKMIDADDSCVNADRVMKEMGVNSLVVKDGNDYFVYNRLNGK